MKILFALTRAFNPNDAGVQRTTYKLGKYFTEQGFEVAYFSTKREGHVHIEYGQLFKVPVSGGLEVVKNVDFLQATIEEWQPDIVINQMPYDDGFRNYLSKFKGQYNYILIGCLRNSLLNFYSNARLKIRQTLPKLMAVLLDNRLGMGLVKAYHKVKHRQSLKAILDKHDCYVLLAPPNKDELRFFVGDYHHEKVAVVPNSIPNIYREVLTQKKKKILYVGSLNIQQKRSDLLVEFWRKVYEELPDWEFIIVGHGAYRKILEQQIRKHNLPRISLEGFQKPEPYYAESAFFMMTSAYEGFPNTILEAHSHACPVLAFNSYGALDWIVNNEKDALISPPFDVSKMAQHAIGLANNSEKLKEMQLNALENASRFTIDRVGREWLQLFDKLQK